MLDSLFADWFPCQKGTICLVMIVRNVDINLALNVISSRWFPEVQNIYYQGNKKKLLPSNQNAKRLEAFFNAADVLMTNMLQGLALDSIDAYSQIFCPPTVSI